MLLHRSDAGATRRSSPEPDFVHTTERVKELEEGSFHGGFAPNPLEALAIRRRSELREAALELRGVEQVVLFVAGKQFTNLPHLPGKETRGGHGPLAYDLVRRTPPERFAGHRDELAVGGPIVAARQVPGLSERVGRVAEGGQRAARVGRPDQGAPRIVAYRHAWLFAGFQLVDDQCVREALRLARAIELGRAPDDDGDFPARHLLQHHPGHRRADSAFAADWRERRFLRQQPVVLRVHVGVVEVGELRARRPACIECVAQHGRELLLPQAGVRRQAGGEIDDPASFDGLGGLPGIEQVGGCREVRFVHLARVAADQPQVAGVVAPQFARQFHGDLAVRAQYRLHLVPRVSMPSPPVRAAVRLYV